MKNFESENIAVGEFNYKYLYESKMRKFILNLLITIYRLYKKYKYIYTLHYSDI